MEILIDRALTAERAALRALDGLADVAEVRLALDRLRGFVRAIECSRGGLLEDPNGRLWGERLESLDRMLRTARDAGQLEKVLRVVLVDLEPLTGSARRDECFC